MRIIHYIMGLPPVYGGGLVKYALDIAAEQQANGNQVDILTQGVLTAQYPAETRICRGNFQHFSCFFVVNGLPVTGGRGVLNVKQLYSEGPIKVYYDFLTEQNPDVIHVHSFMGLHLSFLKAAKALKIPVIFTTHDYYGLCPKAILFEKDTVCEWSDWSHCGACLGESATDKQLKKKQSAGYRFIKNNRFFQWAEYSKCLLPLKWKIRELKGNSQEGAEQQAHSVESVEDYEKLRSYYREMFSLISYFHFNSSQTRRVFEMHLGELKGNVIPVIDKNVGKTRQIKKYDSTLKLGYLGNHQMFKGFPVLKQAVDELYAEGMTDIECHIYFNPRSRVPDYYKIHAPFQAGEAQKVYNGMDVLIVPSLWKETFGMVVVEALSYGVPVMITEHVGAKDVLRDNKDMGIIIRPEKDALKQALKNVYCERGRLREMNEAICQKGDMPDFKKSVLRVLDVYKETCEKFV